MSWDLDRPLAHIKAYLNLVEIAEKACSDFKTIAKCSKERRDHLFETGEIVHVWRTGALPSKLAPVNEDEAEAGDGDGGGAIDGAAEAGGHAGAGDEKGAGDGKGEIKGDDGAKDFGEDYESDGAADTAFEDDDDDEQENDDAWIDKAAPLATDLLNGKVIGVLPLTTEALWVQKIHDEELVELKMREAFNYTAEWAHRQDGSTLRNASRYSVSALALSQFHCAFDAYTWYLSWSLRLVRNLSFTTFDS